MKGWSVLRGHVLPLSSGVAGDFLPSFSYGVNLQIDRLSTCILLRWCSSKKVDLFTARVDLFSHVKYTLECGFNFTKWNLKKKILLVKILLFNASSVLVGEFRGWGREQCCWRWANVESRAPGGYLSPRGSDCSPVGSPPPSSRERLRGFGLGSHLDPVGPCGAPSCKVPGELREESQGLTCLFIWLRNRLSSVFGSEIMFTWFDLFGWIYERFWTIKD